MWLFISAIETQAWVLPVLWYILQLSISPSIFGGVPPPTRFNCMFNERATVPWVNALPSLCIVLQPTTAVDPEPEPAKTPFVPLGGTVGQPVPFKYVVLAAPLVTVSERNHTAVNVWLVELQFQGAIVPLVGNIADASVIPGTQVDSTPSLTGVGPILTNCCPVIVSPPAPWTEESTESSSVIVKSYKPLGVLLTVCVSTPVEASIAKAGCPLIPVGLPAVIDHCNWDFCSDKILLTLVPFIALSVPILASSTVLVIKAKAGEKLGSRLLKAPWIEIVFASAGVRVGVISIEKV